MRNMNVLRSSGLFLASNALGVLVLSGCTEKNNDPPVISHPTATEARVTEDTLAILVSTQGQNGPVPTYNGIDASAASKMERGHFTDGESVDVDCKDEGREVKGNDKISRVWYRLDQQYGQHTYVSAINVASLEGPPLQEC